MEYNYGEEPQEDKMGDLIEKLEPVKNAITAFGVKKLLLILLLLAVVFWYFFILPKPGSLSVRVVQLDDNSKGVGGAEVELTDSNGKSLYLLYSNDDGAVDKFSNVPSEVPLTLRVTPPSNFKEYSDDTVRLKSGKDQKVSVELVRNWELDLSSDVQASLFAGFGCTKNITVHVSNKGRNAVPVEIVGKDDLAPLISSSEKKDVGVNSSEDFAVTITVPPASSSDDLEKGHVYTGGLRVRYSDAELNGISVEAVKPSSLTVSPAEITAQDVTPGQTLKFSLQVMNSGEKEVVRDISADVSGEVKDFTAANFEDTAPLRPGESKYLTVTLSVPGDASPGATYVGQLSLSTSCQQIRVKIALTMRNVVQ